MILTVEVKPNARENRVVSWRDAGTVIVAIAAPARDGKANQELINFLAAQLGIAKSCIKIKRGQSARVKHVLIPDNVNPRLLRSVIPSEVSAANEIEGSFDSPSSS